jgi:EAL domain-containing protein (putative c-di-GMP-specific phosphodiesterase class I)/GGDEF domain-containing protein
MALVRLQPIDLPAVEAPTSSERFTRTLVDLTRAVWHPQCTFETAISSICDAAATALQIERVSVWQHEQGKLTFLHASSADASGEAPASGADMTLDDAAYIRALGDVRTFETVEVDDEPDTGLGSPALRDYLQRHRIRALLDAPAYVDGELQGVICHESINRVRKWTREEITFAASMGDYVAMAYEISRRRRAEDEVEHLRLHDGSTGLGNRDYLVELTRQRLAPLRGNGETLAVVHVFVDASGVAWSANAPTVEDVMARIGRRLVELTSDSIELARVRANGFAFLLSRDGQQRGAVRLAERALAAVRAIVWDHAEVDPSATAGIAFAPVGQGFDARVLMRQAEEAAEHARAGDKFGFEVFDPEHHDTLVESLRFERALRDAFAEGRFEVHYQPEFDAHERTWVAAESLLRWRDGERLVIAAEFIGVVESSGLMLPVGRWVLGQACRDAVHWPAQPNGSLPSVRVNVSTRQFDEGGLVDDVAAALADSGLAAARLCLEITETTLMRDIDHALDVLQQLKRLGVSVAIDDFGTGYASLVYLKRLPVDVLKIDRSFVDGIPGTVADTAIVRAVVGLAASLGMDVIAEGVERIAQQDALQALGVRHMQGWLYGKAMDQDSLRRLLGADVTA